MSDIPSPQDSLSAAERADWQSALFAQLVMQQANIAMMLLGKSPHPESGKTLRDLEGAQLFIDQLEMLETKTRGNLSQEEAALLKQSLMSLRMAFVEAVEAPPAAAPAESPAAKPAATPTAPAGETPPPEANLGTASDAESKKKFSKKY